MTRFDSLIVSLSSLIVSLYIRQLNFLIVKSFNLKPNPKTSKIGVASYGSTIGENSSRIIPIPTKLISCSWDAVGLHQCWWRILETKCGGFGQHSLVTDTRMSPTQLFTGIDDYSCHMVHMIWIIFKSEWKHESLFCQALQIIFDSSCTYNTLQGHEYTMWSWF